MSEKREWPTCPKCGQELEPHDTMLICRKCNGKGMPRARWCTAAAYRKIVIERTLQTATLWKTRTCRAGGWVWLYKIGGQSGVWQKQEEIQRADWRDTMRNREGGVYALVRGTICWFTPHSGYFAPTQREILEAGRAIEALLAEPRDCIAFGHLKQRIRVSGAWTDHCDRIFEGANWADAMIVAAKAKRTLEQTR